MIKYFYVGQASDDGPTEIPANTTEIIRNSEYGVKKIIGLTRPKADINRAMLAGANASRISSAQISERSIVLDINPLSEEVSRQDLYDILPFDTMLRFYIETERRIVYIDGYVETIDGDDVAGNLFGVQISILCPFPWFQSVRLHTQDVPAATTTTEFTFDAVNAGDIECGFEVNQILVGLHPWNSKTSNLDITVANRFFGYDGSIYLPYICTIPGKKAFKGDTRMSDVSQNSNSVVPAFSYMKDGAEWMQFRPGSNAVTVSCGSTDGLRFTWRDTYSGV